MYKTETHLHVSEVSPCGKLKAAEMVKLYHEAGYTTVFISDHFNQAYFDALGDIPWQDKITIFLSGYYKAKEAAKNYGMNVLMSAEIAFVGNPNHYLIYGATKDFLDSCTDLCKMSAEEFYEKAKANDVLVVQAHPYRDGKCFPTPQCVDGMEIFNSNPRHENFSDKCAKCAAENGLYKSAGSDAYRVEDVGNAGVLSEYEIKSAEDFISLIKNGKFEIYKGSNNMKLSQLDEAKLNDLTIEQKSEIVFGNYQDSGVSADVAILLGGNLLYVPKRAEMAAKLYFDGRVKYIVPTGGVEWDNNGEKISEALYMTRLLKEMGVPEDVIILENEARTTKENMLYAAIQLGRAFRIADIRRVIIVTSPGHLRRSMMIGKLLLPRHMEIYGVAADSEAEKPENWHKSDATAVRVDRELGLLKRFVDEKLGEDIEF